MPFIWFVKFFTITENAYIWKRLHESDIHVSAYILSRLAPIGSKLEMKIFTNVKKFTNIVSAYILSQSSKTGWKFFICEKNHKCKIFHENAYIVKNFTKNENAFMSTFWGSSVEYSKEAVSDEKIFIGEKFHKCKNLQKTLTFESVYSSTWNSKRFQKKPLSQKFCSTWNIEKGKWKWKHYQLHLKILQMKARRKFTNVMKNFSLQLKILQM